MAERSLSCELEKVTVGWAASNPTVTLLTQKKTPNPVQPLVNRRRDTYWLFAGSAPHWPQS